MQRFYDESMEAALQAVSSGRQGLTQAEARSRLEKNGKKQAGAAQKGQLAETVLHANGGPYESHFTGCRRHQRGVGRL